MLQQSLGHVMKIHHTAQGFDRSGMGTNQCTAKRDEVTTPEAEVTATWYRPADKVPRVKLNHAALAPREHLHNPSVGVEKRNGIPHIQTTNPHLTAGRIGHDLPMGLSMLTDGI